MRTVGPSSSFEKFMSQRLDASTAFLNGDIEPLDRISAHDSPATIFGPSGTAVQGAGRVNAANAAGSEMFEPGATNEFGVMHQAADERLAYWVGIQRSRVRMRGRDQAVDMLLRVTEIFRRRAGGWVLIHRHADTLSEEPG